MYYRKNIATAGCATFTEKMFRNLQCFYAMKLTVEIPPSSVDRDRSGGAIGVHIIHAARAFCFRYNVVFLLVEAVQKSTLCQFRVEVHTYATLHFEGRMLTVKGDSHRRAVCLLWSCGGVNLEEKKVSPV